MSELVDDLLEWAAQEEIGVTEAGHHILRRAAAEILRLRSQMAALLKVKEAGYWAHHAWCTSEMEAHYMNELDEALSAYAAWEAQNGTD